uniref:Ubiquitin specific peptidase 40 n=1 Tax=Erpetoichthys calabaricus TaxID=27687 RepID=A0A8C4S247_ERPCA
MFGDLFEEDNEAFLGGGSKTQKGKDSKEDQVEQPPPPRGPVNLSGLKNQGGTCYLNSLLQTLLFTPEFREALFNLGQEELGCLADRNKPGAKVRVIPLELQRLFAQLLLVDQQAASTIDLTDSFGWTSKEESNQHDVQELNRILFSALECSLISTLGHDLINKLYHGIVVNQISCKECGNLSERQEDFLDLTVAVKGVHSLEEALYSMFVEEELFDGNNRYRCSGCNNLVRATKSAKLRHLPPFLTVSLLRFNFDFAKCERYKETGKYTFPLKINLKPFSEQADQAIADYDYELFSVIIHKGGCYGGHYHVYIRDVDELGNWQSPGEEKPKPKMSLKEMKINGLLDLDDPLSIIKTILAKEEGSGVRTDQLGQKLLEQVGISWNKKYRKRYGSIWKFIQQNSDVFYMDSDGSTVHLKCNKKPGLDSDDQTLLSSELLTCTNMSCEGQWFDFNDSIVLPIQIKDIQKQFEGKESAYMLFYRKSCLKRPSDARKNPKFKVPAHLIEETEQENMKLQKLRADFDLAKNLIEIHVHQGSKYHFFNGALHPFDQITSILNLHFDKRKTVRDLREVIYQQLGSKDDGSELTFAKRLPAGLHLYDHLTDDNESINNVGIKQGSDLFLWNGKEVNGVTLKTGIEFEPVLLNIICLNESKEITGGATEFKETQQCFARDTLLHDACEAVIQVEFSKEFNIYHQRKGQKFHSNNWTKYSATDFLKTISDLSLEDGDSILVVNPHNSDSCLLKQSGNELTLVLESEWLEVEYFPNRKSSQNEKKTVKVPADERMLLSEIKLKAIEELELEICLESKSCLRQIDRNGKLLPPVCGDATVNEAGVKLKSTLALCPGCAPTSTQIFLYYIVGADPQTEMEIVVEESTTVKECLKMLLDLTGLKGDCWHLRKVDWCYEVGEPLKQEDAVLKDVNILSGDTLVIAEGKLPPKGFLKLPVWIYPMQSYYSMVDQDYQTDEISYQISKLNISVSDVCEGELQYSGEMEISNEATVEDLKIQAMTLPYLHNISVPSAEFLRAWILEKKRPTKILKGNHNRLKSKELLLKVQMSVPGEKQYYPAEDLIWDTTKECTALALRQRIASHFSLSLDQIDIAKYFPEKFEWMVVSSWTQQVTKRKKRKNKQCLQESPFYLKDGDIIGVKNLLVDSNKEFSTWKDDFGKEKIKQDKEDKKKRGQRVHFENEKTCTEKKPYSRCRKPEATLSINVGVFR